jgi:Mrp family chromosome partitioning ATPase
VIAADERKRMLAVRLCGERVLMRLESVGVTRLSDLRGRDAWELMHEINLEAGRPIWRAPLAVAALQNLIDAAEWESTRSPTRGEAVHDRL